MKQCMNFFLFIFLQQECFIRSENYYFSHKIYKYYIEDDEYTLA